ncbi:MAG: MFS transporter [Chloroflexota bacterium]
MASIFTAKQSRLPFVLSLSIFILLGISGGILNIAWTPMQDTFNVDVSAIGILLFFATLGAMIATFVSGTLLTTFRFHTLILVAMGVLAIGMFMMASASTWFILLVVIFITYMGRGVLDAGFNHFFSVNYDTSAMNWLHASWGIGLTVAPFLMTMILVDFGLSWRVGYISIGVIAIVMIVLIASTLSVWSLGETQDANTPETDYPPASPMEAIRQPAIIVSMLIFFLYGGVEIGTGQLANTLLVDGRQVSQEVAGLWLSFYWGAFTVGRILLGWIAMRFADKFLLRFGMITAIVGAFILAWNPMPLIGLLGLIAIGFGLSGIFPTLISMTAQRVGQQFSAQAIGFQIGSAGLGASLLPGLIGMFAGQLGLEWISIGILLNAICLFAFYEAVNTHR